MGIDTKTKVLRIIIGVENSLVN